jgi:hypothetical protein
MPDERRSFVVSVTVVAADESQAHRAHEVMSRLALGLAMDGLSASTHIAVDDYVEEEVR